MRRKIVRCICQTLTCSKEPVIVWVINIQLYHPRDMKKVLKKQMKKEGTISSQWEKLLKNSLKECVVRHSKYSAILSKILFYRLFFSAILPTALFLSFYIELDLKTCLLFFDLWTTYNQNDKQTIASNRSRAFAECFVYICLAVNSTRQSRQIFYGAWWALWPHSKWKYFTSVLQL